MGILVNGDMGISFRGIGTDTRILEPGFLFWALKGKNFDGHHFWKEALEKGAKGLVLDYFPQDLKLEEIPKTISIILVRNTLQALGDLARWYRKQKEFKVIAITGSCGKTTTKEITYTLLSQIFKVGKNYGNYNNLIGVPLTLLSLKEPVDWVVLELGTNQKGEIARLGEITEPFISALTCIYPAHLEGLGSIEGVLQEKTSLWEKTYPQGGIVYFYDQRELREVVQRFSQKKISFGEEEGADLRLLSVEESGGENRTVSFIWEDRIYSLEVNFIGRHNLLNLLCAIGIALLSGLKMEEILKRLPKDLTFLERGELYSVGNWTILDDTYNANPGSMKKALLWLKEAPEIWGVKIVLLGDMKELGKYSKELHYEIGKLAGEIADKGYFIGEWAEAYGEGFSLYKKPWKAYSSVEDFLEKEKFSEERAVILIKGSRALRLERIVEELLKERI